METAFAIATLWYGLALVATFLASRFQVSGALMEIVVGIGAAALLTTFGGPDAMGANLPWLSFSPALPPWCSLSLRARNWSPP